MSAAVAVLILVLAVIGAITVLDALFVVALVFVGRLYQRGAEERHVVGLTDLEVEMSARPRGGADVFVFPVSAPRNGRVELKVDQ
jgi:hypothetical protein